MGQIQAGKVEGKNVVERSLYAVPHLRHQTRRNPSRALRRPSVTVGIGNPLLKKEEVAANTEQRCIAVVSESFCFLEGEKGAEMKTLPGNRS